MNILDADQAVSREAELEIAARLVGALAEVGEFHHDVECKGVATPVTLFREVRHLTSGIQFFAILWRIHRL